MRPALAILAISSCATTPPPAPAPPGSRGMRASEHIQAAHQQDELAQQALAYPNVRAGVDEPPFATAWNRTWDTRVEHERLAQVHRSEAGELQAEYDEACRGRSGAEISVSPIARFAIGGTPTPDGVTVYLSADAGAPGPSACRHALPSRLDDARAERHG